jgi:hypothetical protein
MRVVRALPLLPRYLVKSPETPIAFVIRSAVKSVGICFPTDLRCNDGHHVQFTFRMFGRSITLALSLLQHGRNLASTQLRLDTS